MAAFFRRDELAGDATNWFSPNLRALEAWFGSCGFETNVIAAWPEGAPTRALIAGNAVAGDAEWRRISYERPVHAAKCCSLP